MIILFSMALYSFGGENGQCGVTSWAVQETGMLPLLSCGRRIQVCPGGRRGRTGDAKATGDSKDQLGIINAHK